MPKKYYQHKGLALSRGNEKVSSKGHRTIRGRKVRRQTLILNMGSGSSCASQQEGLCKICEMRKAGAHIDCYAFEVERFRTCVFNYRQRQREFWRNHTAAEIVAILDEVMNQGRYIKHGETVDGFRFNEAGDLETVADCIKAAAVSRYMRDRWNVRKQWIYTANKALAFLLKKLAPWLCVKGSGFMGPDGMTVVLLGKDIAVPYGFHECKEDCSVCSQCAVKGSLIAFRAHGGTVNINRAVKLSDAKWFLWRFYGLLAA